MSADRFVLVDDAERHVIDHVLSDAEPGHPAAAAWQPRPGDGRMVVHGLRDAGHLLRIPEITVYRDWLVDQLRTLAETADHAGRVLGCIPAWFVEQVVDRIVDEQASAGAPGSVRVGAEDLRALLDAGEVAAAVPARSLADRAWRDAISDVVQRVSVLAAMTWTEPTR